MLKLESKMKAKENETYQCGKAHQGVASLRSEDLKISLVPVGMDSGHS
jgi:hypothetical protein